MKIEVITSFNQAYYDAIGQHAVESWTKYWPQDMQLTCYVEQCSIEQSDRIRLVDFEEFGCDYWRFQEEPTLKSRAKIFAKKAWSFIHASQNTQADRVIWIDADVITISSITKEFLYSLLPTEVLSTHLGVTYWEDKRGRPGPWLVPETGFFAVNTRHEKFCEFIDEYHRRYHEQDYADLRRFYDNDVYGAALTKIVAPVLDLCANLPKPYKTPLEHTVLGPYLHHYKAKHRKEQFQADCQ